MKRILTYTIGFGIVASAFIGVNSTEAETRTSELDSKGVTISESSQPLLSVSPSSANRSDNENNYREKSYSFSLDPIFVNFDDDIVYKDEDFAKENVQHAFNILNDITDNGTDFSKVNGLYNNEDWAEFVEVMANLKYEGFEDSEILNDLNVAGALILQAEGHYDEPSFTYLYKVIADLHSGIEGEAVENKMTRTFENDSIDEVLDYMDTKK